MTQVSNVADKPAPTKSAPKMVFIKALQRDVLKAISAVTGIVEAHSPMPVLANVLLVKRGEDVEFTSSDLEIQMRTSAAVGGGSGDGSATVGARKLVEILKSLPVEQTVTLTQDGTRMTLTSGKSRFSLQTLPSEDFPLVKAAGDLGAPFALPSRVLRDLIGQVHYCMGVRDVRHFLNGMLLEAKGNRLRVVGTDGTRLVMAEAQIESPLDERAVIIPRKAVLELFRQLKDDDSEVMIALAGNQATFKCNGVEFTTKLLEGKYPDYERVIPQSVKTKVIFERTMLLSVLSRAALMCSQKFKGVSLQFSEEKLTVTSSNEEQEQGNQEIGIDYSGRDLNMGFNVSFLLDALQNIQADTVTLGIRDETSSTVLYDPDHPATRCVLMPMRI